MIKYISVFAIFAMMTVAAAHANATIRSGPRTGTAGTATIRTATTGAGATPVRSQGQATSSVARTTTTQRSASNISRAQPTAFDGDMSEFVRTMELDAVKDTLSNRIDSIAISGGGTPGADGREIELQVGAAHIQWRYVGGGAWHNLVSLAEITGPTGAAGADGLPGTMGLTGPRGADGTDGRNVEISVIGNSLAYRLAGDAFWNDLISLDMIGGGVQPEHLGFLAFLNSAPRDRLSQDVQSSLARADSAIQESDINNVIRTTGTHTVTGILNVPTQPLPPL
ncbi:MAG: collagen-like protein [Alphaproteobacteria bacterium]|nr:collagen-like protein [Alphaproteobacteria bacterium]MCL2758521.1 collagen-like protein [Alphaproteobacteria bacterium]